MKKAPRFLRYFLFCLLGLALMIGGFFAYFIYTPDPKMPQLSGVLTKRTMQVGGLTRTYRTYLPKELSKGAPLLVVLHGSGQNGAQIRLETGYEFDRLADQHGFAVVYPNAKSFDWNDCSKVGDFTADGREVDDVKFLEALVDKLIAEHGLDQRRVFAAGVSSGGFMSIRLALESAAHFRAVGAISANVPVADNFKCKPSSSTTASVMIMNGTKDPLVPYSGGESSLFGLFYKGGEIRSSQDSAVFFAEINKIGGKSVVASISNADSMGIADKQKFDLSLWRDEGKVEVALATIRDGGHGMPQPHWRRPRLLGPSPMTPNGPAIIWEFFARQKR